MRITVPPQEGQEEPEHNKEPYAVLPHLQWEVKVCTIYYPDKGRSCIKSNTRTEMIIKDACQSYAGDREVVGVHQKVKCSAGAVFGARREKPR